MYDYISLQLIIVLPKKNYDGLSYVYQQPIASVVGSS
jgi:hypothetical protein